MLNGITVKYYALNSVGNNHSNLDCDKGRIVTTHLPGLFTATNVDSKIICATQRSAPNNEGERLTTPLKV